MTPDLDTLIPRSGPCGICGLPGADARHRVIDAIADRVAGGEGPEEVAADYGLPVEVVALCTAYAADERSD